MQKLTVEKKNNSFKKINHSPLIFVKNIIFIMIILFNLLFNYCLQILLKTKEDNYFYLISWYLLLYIIQALCCWNETQLARCFPINWLLTTKWHSLLGQFILFDKLTMALIKSLIGKIYHRTRIKCAFQAKIVRLSGTYPVWIEAELPKSFSWCTCSDS